jgi:hypothetical protein
MSFYSKHLLPWLIGVDESINALCGGAPDETISGTCGRAMLKGNWIALHIWGPFINFLMQNPNHCLEAAAAEAKRRQETGQK